MNSKERIQFSQQLVANHYIYPNNMPLTGYEYVLSRYYSGALTKEQFQTEVDRLQTMNTDWFDLLTKDSFSKDYAINVSGGSDNIRWVIQARTMLSDVQLIDAIQLRLNWI